MVREVFSQLSQKFITDSQVIVAKSHLDDLASKIKALEAKLSETDTNQNPTDSRCWGQEIVPSFLTKRRNK